MKETIRSHNNNNRNNKPTNNQNSTRSSASYPAAINKIYKIRMSRSKELKILPGDFVPGPNTVICAKGKDAKIHPGNVWLRALVKEHLEEYSGCTSKLDRSFLVSKIIKTIKRGGASGSGMFVRKVHGTWYDVGDRNAREKVGQQFRDALPNQFKSSNKAKANMKRCRLGSSNGSQSDTSSSCCHSQQPCTPPPHTRSIPLATTSASRSFPISEVSFTSSTDSANLIAPRQDQAAKAKTALNWRELEPLPLAQAVALNFDFSSSSIATADITFEDVMNDFQQHFSVSEVTSNASAHNRNDPFAPLPFPY